MALIPEQVDYTDRDFSSLRARLFNLISSVFPTWTETSVANFGNILVELYAFVGDVLAVYQDNQANEAFIVTAQLRRSLLAHARRLNFTPMSASAATVDLIVQLAVPPAGDVTIVAGDQFSTLEVTDPVVFQALADVVIAAGTDPPTATVTVENSHGSSESFQSDGTPNQKFDLSDTPFLDGSLSVSADNGAYTVVADLLDSTSTDNHLTVSVDENDRARIVFGNGVNGAIPLGVIVAGYKTGGGAAGNVDAGAVKRPAKAYIDSLGNPVQLTCSNPLRASGGSPRQSIESIREQIPRSLRALTRSVTREDFETNALRVPGALRALMLTRNEDPSVDENAGRLYVVPSGGGQPSSALLAAVTTMVTVTYPHTLTFRVEVLGPTYKTITVHAVVYPTFGVGTAAQNSVLGSRIRANLAAFFAQQLPDGSLNPGADFGANTDGLVAMSDVFDVVRDTTEVRRVGDRAADFLLNGQHVSVAIDYSELPELGAVTLINGTSGAVIP